MSTNTKNSSEQSGRIYNKSSFLDNLAKKLGRERQLTPVAKPAFRSNCHQDVMADFSQDQLKDVLVEYTQSTLGANAIVTTQADLTATLKQECLNYCQNDDALTSKPETDKYDISISADTRLLGLIEVEELQDSMMMPIVWDQSLGYQGNIEVAERAKVGIVFAEQALAESGTMVLYSQAAQGRAISLLPEASIFVVPKSALVPRITQATERLHHQAQRGERVPSCVNFISGPSSTADIELIKVVGVHGPVYATYVIIDDL
ncbi:lactate utilization protein C [Vibrio sp. SS-MA-C1-2]|uniref:LutC/YkgG family protein n=1 Tax=Vibrio sp. SS-MA-C1-2 TaxID=2908646 RepID=UPI001F418129|nr:lactate utilization protein C [Vibrio sp. SS-MA-C1-2]UJF18184.1 lactate utilization protein C [Vibrio sp. SS-MA-C1-2]